MTSGDDSRILQGWRAFIEASEIEKGKISANAVSQDQQHQSQPEIWEEDETGITITLPQQKFELLKRRYVTVSEDGTPIVTALQLSFPIFTIPSQYSTYFQPLFRFSVPSEWLLQDQPKLHIPLKQGNLVKPISGAFGTVLDMEPEELGKDRHALSIMTACMGQEANDCASIYQNFLIWLDENQIKPRFQLFRETGFDMLFSEEKLENTMYRHVLDEYDTLANGGLASYSLLANYLQRQAKPSNVQPWGGLTYGLFERDNALGRGQLHTLSRVAAGDALVAAQGAPGTGKTTLFMSLIASQIVKRALAIIVGKDANLGVLVASTAIKAVNNIVDKLCEDSTFSGLNWLYFVGGNKKRIEAECLRVDALLAEFNVTEYDAQAQQASRTALLSLQTEIEQGHAEYQARSAPFEQARLALGDEDPHAARDRLACMRQALLKRAEQLGLTTTASDSDELASMLTHCDARYRQAEAAMQADQAAKTALRASFAYLGRPILPLEHYADWLASDLAKALTHHFGDYRSSLFSRIGRLFGTGRYEQARAHLRSLYANELADFGLSHASQEEMAALARNYKDFFQHHHGQQHLAVLQQAADSLEAARAISALATEAKEILRQEALLKTVLEGAQQLAQCYPEGDWPNVLRLRYVKQQRAMLEHAIAFLWQENLRCKVEIADVLRVWSDQIRGQKNSGYYHWHNRRKDFFRLLSLAYPVLTSTLVSAQRLAGFSKLEDASPHKPFHMALIDEAGMVSVESVVPLLARSERATMVGDPMQLEPIRVLSQPMTESLRERHFQNRDTLYEAMSPMLTTAYHRAAGAMNGAPGELGNSIVLDEHRRCQPAIADLFIAIAGYRGVDVMTSPPAPAIAQAFALMGSHPLMFYGVEGRAGTQANTNLDEQEAIGAILDKLEEAGYDLKQHVGIITPYANQKRALIKLHGTRLAHTDKNNRIGTVHQFQGTDFEVIIYSPVIFRLQDRDGFQNNKPNLLNVAISRAKQQFIVVGNHRRLLAAGKSLGTMARIVSNGFLLDSENQSASFEAAQTRQPNPRYVLDCDHITTFEHLLQKCTTSFRVIVPWLRQGSMADHPQLDLLKQAQNRGVTVSVHYGYRHQKYDTGKEDDAALVQAYQDTLGVANVIRIPEGTHEKILIVDNATLVIGSWNWLSHSYHRYCLLPQQRRLAIRHETSVQFDDPDFCRQLQQRISA
ncbi:AAA domain-containing protein [Kerstersia sp.]|uniref:AAA domain-containing protein n=1 Tax=Kerstersia sp. TaxID=1930783 RepID=UPI003F902756